MSKRDRKNGVPETVTSIPLVDPHALSDNPSIGELVRDATTQVSTLVRAEVELAKAEITRDVKKGLTGSVFFIAAGLVALYSTFFLFFFLAELLDTWQWRWAAFLLVFLLMILAAALFAFLGYRKVRRIRGPQQTIESVKETTAALTPGLQKFAGGGPSATSASTTTAMPPARPAPPIAPKPRSAVTSAPASAPVRQSAPAPAASPVVATEVRHEQTVVAEEPDVQYDTAGYTEETAAYADDAAYYEPPAQSTEIAYADDETVVVIESAVVYADDTAAYSDEPTGPIPPITGEGDDPTAAIYADTGLPITPEHEQRPGDPSGS